MTKNLNPKNGKQIINSLTLSSFKNLTFFLKNFVFSKTFYYFCKCLTFKTFLNYENKNINFIFRFVFV